MLNRLLINSIIAGSTYTLIALGLSPIYSTIKFFHFGQRKFMGLWVIELMSFNTGGLEKRL